MAQFPSDPRPAVGRRAEAIAGLYLRLLGWSIIGRRQRVAGVEIDLLARKGRVVAVVEVKSRRRLPPKRQDSRDFVSRSQLWRLVTAARHLAERREFRSSLVRVDLILVALSGVVPRIRRVENAGATCPPRPGCRYF